MRIIVDVMSGDNAPLELVKGVCASAHENPDVDYTLVGNSEVISSTAESLGLDISRFEIKHTEVVIEMDDETHGRITLTEGKYHQIKRMFERAGSEVVFLKRESFAGIPLDTSLAPGEWRYLTDEEEKLLRGVKSE